MMLMLLPYLAGESLRSRFSSVRFSPGVGPDFPLPRLNSRQAIAAVPNHHSDVILVCPE
jgi:hypothetical protein